MKSKLLIIFLFINLFASTAQESSTNSKTDTIVSTNNNSNAKHNNNESKTEGTITNQYKLNKQQKLNNNMWLIIIAASLLVCIILLIIISKFHFKRSTKLDNIGSNSNQINVMEDEHENAIKTIPILKSKITELENEIASQKEQIEILNIKLLKDTIEMNTESDTANTLEFDITYDNRLVTYYHHDIEEDQISLKISKATDLPTPRSIYEIREVGTDISLYLIASASITKHLIDYSRWQLEPFFDLPSTFKPGITLIKSRIPAKFYKDGDFWFLQRKGTLEFI